MPNLIDLMMGNTPRQRIDSFVEKELPAIAENIQRATTMEEVIKHEGALIGAALKAGYQPQQVEHLIKATIGPAKEGLGAAEFAKIGKSLGPQTQNTVTNTPTAPPPGLASMMGPESAANVTLPFSVEQTQTPGRQFGQEDAMKLAAVTGRMGGNPTQGLAPMLQVPSQVQQNQMEAEAAEALAAERRAEERLKSQQMTMRNDPSLSPEARVVAGADSPSLASYLSAGHLRTQQQPKIDAEVGKLGAETRYADAGVPLRQAQTGAQRALTGKYGAEAERAREQARTEGPRRYSLTATGDLANEKRTNPDRFKATLDANGNPIVTSTEEQRFVNADQQAIDREVITEEIARRGADTPEAQAAIAAEYGYELTGTPTVEKPNSILGALGLGGKPALSGQFSLRPAAKSRSVSKERVVPGGQPVRPTTAPGQQPKTLDRDTAAQILQEAGGDKNKARQLAQQRGYQF